MLKNIKRKLYSLIWSVQETTDILLDHLYEPGGVRVVLFSGEGRMEVRPLPRLHRPIDVPLTFYSLVLTVQPGRCELANEYMAINLNPLEQDLVREALIEWFVHFGSSHSPFLEIRQEAVQLEAPAS